MSYSACADLHNEPLSPADRPLAVSVRGASKCYTIYDNPADRLKQALIPRTSRVLRPWRETHPRYYREFWALQPLSFEIKRGETLGIVGRNGSGKSTLLQLLAGTLTPTTGEVGMRGRVSALLELGSGFNPEYSGRDNVFLTGAILGIPHQEMRERFDSIAAFADIGNFIDQPVKTYSSGMHARLAFSVAISVSPEILIVDEILAVGDLAFQRKCFKEFHRLRDSGCTVILVTQDPYVIRSFCDVGLYLRKGQVAAIGDPTTVADRYLLELEAAEKRDEQIEEQAHPSSENEAPRANESGFYRITEVALLNENNQASLNFRTGQQMRVRFRYTASSRDEVSFVLSIYRHDGLYISGATSLMDGLKPFTSASQGEVEITIADLPLLAGRYSLRVAIDDERGLGIYTEAHSEEFEIQDDLQSVALVHLKRTWSHKS